MFPSHAHSVNGQKNSKTEHLSSINMKQKRLFTLWGLVATMVMAGAVCAENAPAPSVNPVADVSKVKRVTPAEVPGQPPSDALVLFDGTQKSLDANWCDNRGNTSRWKCIDGAAEATRGVGNLCTRRKFGDVQLHVEWRTPVDPGTNPMNRGNSGVFLLGDLYEVQVFESYETNPADMKFHFYADGQAASIYGQNPPLVNPTRKPGEWQAYDIIFHPPVFKDNTCVHPGTLTVFLNGVLVQDHWNIEGPTWHCRRTYQVKPNSAKESIQLQEHNCPVRFRNVWVRELPSRHVARP